MLDGNVLLRQKRDEVPEGTLSCPDRNLAVFHHYRHYEGLRLLPSVYDSKLIQQTLLKPLAKLECFQVHKSCCLNSLNSLTPLTSLTSRLAHRFFHLGARGGYKDMRKE